MDLILTIILASLVSTARVFVVIGLSILTGWGFGYISIKSKVFENVYVALNEVFESVPVIAFFPVVLILFVNRIGGFVGVELASDFLVFTAVVWNIWIGIYQAFKTVPISMIEEIENLRYGFLNKLKYLYIPFSMPRIAANLIPSFSDAFFYIMVSEVFTIGSTSYSTFGIGSLIVKLVRLGMWNYVSYALLILGVIIGGSVYLLREFSTYAIARYSLESDIPIPRTKQIQRYVAKFYSPIIKPTKRIRYYFASKYTPVRGRKERGDYDYYSKKEIEQRILKVLGSIIAFLILGIIIYSSFSLLTSITYAEWKYIFSNTLEIVYALAYDYARVAVIAVLSFLVALFASYSIVNHKKVEALVISLIQMLAAYPAPAYFPILFAVTYGIVYRFSGTLTTEFFVILLGFLSTFYYIFYNIWVGIKAIPKEIWELMDNLGMNYFQRIRYVVLPGTLPYIITGLTSTINSAWGGLMIAEYWPNIVEGKSLEVSHGLMKLLDLWTYQGNLMLASWASFIFSLFVIVFSVVFTRNMMNLSKEKYVIEEGIYAA
ncbi:MAG: ABC transporter permease subunit [Caldisphaeraceae archaeon]|nr:ABC transporter permease subunit [Caldisphaeraceae archaeon]